MTIRTNGLYDSVHLNLCALNEAGIDGELLATELGRRIPTDTLSLFTQATQATGCGGQKPERGSGRVVATPG